MPLSETFTPEEVIKRKCLCNNLTWVVNILLHIIPSFCHIYIYIYMYVYIKANVKIIHEDNGYFLNSYTGQICIMITKHCSSENLRFISLIKLWPCHSASGLWVSVRLLALTSFLNKNSSRWKSNQNTLQTCVEILNAVQLNWCLCKTL